MAVLCTLGGYAQEEQEQWVLEEPASGTTVAVADVSFLLASDWTDTFSIVCNDGTTITDVTSVNVTRATPSGIDAAKTAANAPDVAITASGQLSLTGLKAGTAVEIFDTAGRLMQRATATEGTLNMNISQLTAGVYVLRAGDTAVKFSKR